MLLHRIIFLNSRNSYYSYKIRRNIIKDCTLCKVDTVTCKCSIFYQDCIFHFYETGVPFSIWMTVPCSYIEWILLTNQEAHGTSWTVKIIQKLRRTESCFFKKKLKQMSLPLKDFSVDFYLFNFINWRKCLSAINLGLLERTEALAPYIRSNSRWNNCKHYYSLPKARSFTDSPYFRKLIQFSSCKEQAIEVLIRTNQIFSTCIKMLCILCADSSTGCFSPILLQYK